MGFFFNLLAYHTVPPDYPYVVSNKSLVNIECVLMHKSIKKHNIKKHSQFSVSDYPLADKNILLV